jgi:hypothetical protein
MEIDFLLNTFLPSAPNSYASGYAMPDYNLFDFLVLGVTKYYSNFALNRLDEVQVNDENAKLDFVTLCKNILARLLIHKNKQDYKNKKNDNKLLSNNVHEKPNNQRGRGGNNGGGRKQDLKKNDKKKKASKSFDNRL